MAAHPERFRETVLAELMPPLGKDGRSAFWEAFGRRFTGLDYPTADKKSRENKEFIQQLFPPFDVYTTLLPRTVQRQLGAVGRPARPAERLLKRLGFRFVDRIDPFDGGPHFEARLADLSAGEGPPGGAAGAAAAGGWLARATWWPASRPSGAIASGRSGPPGGIAPEGLMLPAEARRLLGAAPGEPLHLAPFA